MVTAEAVVEMDDLEQSENLGQETDKLQVMTPSTGTRKRSLGLLALGMLMVLLVAGLLAGILILSNSNRDDEGTAEVMTGPSTPIDPLTTTSSSNSSTAPERSPTTDSPHANLVLSASGVSTLDVVRERGYVRCGVSDGFEGFASTNPETGLLEGINVDQVS